MRYIQTKPRTVINVTRIVTIHYYEFGSHFVFQGESHDFWEMVYVDKGRVEIVRDGETISLKQGEIVFHKPNEFHSIRALDSSPNFFVVSFACGSAAMQYFEGYRTQLNKTLKAYLSPIIQEAEKTYIIPKNDPNLKKLERKPDAPLGGEQLIKIYLEQLLIFLLREITRTGEVAFFPRKDPTDEPLIGQIKSYLADQVEQTVHIADICREFGYSRSFLSRYFQSRTGESLAAYFVGLKIARAKQLIRETNLNFAQISASLAFENPQYFSRVFKRCTGMTPTEFKNRAHI